jgi:hypothetical protein
MGMTWHDMCELASADQRQHVGHQPACSFYWLPHGVLEGCYQKHTNPLNWTSSSDISSSHAEFHERPSTVGERQGRGMAWQGNGMEAAWHV